MKKSSTGQSTAGSKGRFLAYAAYAAAALLFGLGQMKLNSSVTQGAGLVAAGLLLGALTYVLPKLPWAAWRQALREARAARKNAASGRSAAKGAERLPLAARLKSPLAGLGGVLDGLCARFFPEDRLSIARYWLLAPAGALLLAALLKLNQGSVPGAVGVFVVAAFLAWVYLQEPERPLQLHQLRANLGSLAGLSVALPFQAAGAYILHARFGRASMVWLAAILCAAASAWMIRSLKRRPLDFRDPDAAPAELGWEPVGPFYQAGRFSLISSLLAGAALSAYLATSVLPAEHPGWSVGLGFLAIALLVGSFPWIPRGLAWAQQLPLSLRAYLSLGAALLAMVIGAHGQGLMDRGNVSGALWSFLFGGVLLIAALSRFEQLQPSARLGGEAAPSKPLIEVAVVLLLLAVSFSFRIWKIGIFPYGVEGDEGGGGVWAMDTLTGHVEHPLIHQNYPLAFFSVTAFFFKLAGVSLSTLRWHSVLFGTLSIASTYAFLRLMTGRWTAFLMTTLMSFSYWHLHYSRFGHYNIEQVAMQMVAFYFVFKAMRTEKLWQWVVGGVAFGLAMFPHMASRLLPFQGIALVLFFFLGRRDLLRRHLPGFLAFVLASWAIAAPAVVYWNRARSVSMGRIQSVSIFDKNNTNAPIDTLDGFVRNSKVSMLMFNQLGDTRQRDNPLAPEKILEHWTAILFALAFVYALYHWRDPATFFLLSVFFVNLAASAFSVEAPQTLRTAGNIPIIFALIALPLASLRSSLLQLGRVRGTALFALLLLPAIGWFSYRSAEKYFVQARRLQFDTSATYVAEKAGKEGGPDTQAVFWGTGFASSHPPMILLTQQTPLRNFYGLFEYLPINKAVERDHLLFLVDEYQQALPYLRALYPQAKVEPIPDLVNGGDLAQYIRVNKDEIRGTLGLSGEATVGGRPLPLKGVEPRFPLPGAENASRIRLSGSVQLESYGHYRFNLIGKGSGSLSIDGHPAFSGPANAQGQELLLARGLHSVTLQYSPSGPGDTMRIHMSVTPPHGQVGNWVARGRSEGELSLNETLSVEPSGFYAEYYAMRAPEGQPLVELIEPVVMNNWLDGPIVGTWTARWRTRFKAELAGDYRFSHRGGGSFSSVRVDGHLVWRQGQDPRGEMHPPAVEPSIRLAPGWHDYEAVFTTSGPPSDQLRWQQPGKADELFWAPGLRPLNSKMPR